MESLPTTLADCLLDENLPYVTNAFPGIGGILKSEPEDFLVEEIPLYAPSGEGDYFFVQVEKKNLDARSMISRIANTLSISKRDIGMAGIKDRRAITRQTLSIPVSVGEDSIQEIDALENIRLLDIQRHSNKLRTGHLRGNRFTILIRDPQGDDLLENARNIANIVSNGTPNFFGGQRFGRNGQTAELGWSLIHDPNSPQARKARRDPFLKRLAISAIQSLVFNRYLVARMQEGTLNQVLLGDWMMRRDSGGPFLAEDLSTEQRRFDDGETVITGVLPGKKVKWATETSGQFEQKILAEAGLTREHFAPFGKLALGTRRPLLAYPSEMEVEMKDEHIQMSFSLAKGSYATTLLREFMKSPAKPS